MFLIPGQVIAALTFPGVIVHELAHQLFCRFFRVAVFDVCYFRFENPVGYVIHEPPSKASHHVLIGVGPFIISSLLGAFIAFPAATPVLRFETGTVLDYFLIWLGVSIAMHSFPSTADANSIWEAISGKDVPVLLRFISKPAVGLIYLGAIGSVFWLDLVYGIAIAMLLPELLISFLV